MVNRSNLLATADFLAAHDHDQYVWASADRPEGIGDDDDLADWMAEHNWCGTSFCIAGAAVVVAGWKPDWPNAGRHAVTSQARKVTPEGRVVYGDIQEIAAGFLGLDPEEAEVLFSGDWGSRLDKKEVPEILRRIADGDTDLIGRHLWEVLY